MRVFTVMNVRLDVHAMNTLDEVLRRMAWRHRLDEVKTSAWYSDCWSSSSRTAPSPNVGLAAELGMAVGLVNAYLNRCIQKGLVKATQAPARRYAYYLTPQGFARKIPSLPRIPDLFIHILPPSQVGLSGRV